MLSAAIGRSPWSTWISTAVWLSSAVEKTSAFLIGMVVLRSISTVITPPSVSTPSESGVTSSRSDVLDVAGQNAGLDRRPDGDHLVRVDALVRLLARQRAHQILDHRHARGAADQDHLIRFEADSLRVPQHRLERPADACQQVFGQLLELGPGELQSASASARRRRQ